MLLAVAERAAINGRAARLFGLALARLRGRGQARPGALSVALGARRAAQPPWRPPSRAEGRHLSQANKGLNCEHGPARCAPGPSKIRKGHSLAARPSIGGRAAYGRVTKRRCGPAGRQCDCVLWLSLLSFCSSGCRCHRSLITCMLPCPALLWPGRVRAIIGGPR